MAHRVLCLLALIAAVEASARSLLSGRPVGPDVSHYQGSVDWNKVRAGGAGFAVAKATEGVSYVDDTFSANWAGMNRAGIGVRGAYHFGHPSSDAVTQAQHFLSVVGSLSAGDFVALDIEAADSQSASAVASWSKHFVDEVQRRSGLPASRILVYTGAWFWNPQAGGSSVVGDHPLWVSGYTSSPPLPSGWSDWTMWQYTDKEERFGINGCDASYFQGTQDELEALVGLGPSPSPTPTPPPTPPPTPASCPRGYCKANSPANACGCCAGIEADCGHTATGSPYYCQGARDARCPLIGANLSLI